MKTLKSPKTYLEPLSSTPLNQADKFPLNICPHHYQEWLDSGVDPEIIALNVQSLEGNNVYEALCYGLPHDERRNDGRLRDKWLKRYELASQGAWGCAGINLLTGKDSQWGCLKPDIAYTYIEYKNGFDPVQPVKKKKTIKYEHPAKTATEIFALRVPDTIWQRIAERHGVAPYCPLPDTYFAENPTLNTSINENEQLLRETPSPENSSLHTSTKENEQVLKETSATENSSLHTPINENEQLFRECVHNPYAQFWAWAIDANIPLTITEGAKKAGKLLASGYCALALPGIFNGYRQPKDKLGHKIGLPHLLPQLKPFATQGGDPLGFEIREECATAFRRREVNFCFDNDSKIKTKINVRRAIEKTGKLFSLAGCEVKVIQWNDSEKGVDDLIVAKGQDYFESVYNSRITLAQYKLNSFSDLSPYIDLTINEQFIPEGLTVPENAKIIGLKSLHGTGKTEWLSKKIEKYLNDGQRVLVIVHREQLARELARRFGIDYRTEVYESETKGFFGYTLCIDSLHPHANPPFDPDKWENTVLVIDEVEQVLWHLLNGGTCQNNRPRILRTFKKLLQTVAHSELGKIFIADADLSPISINYLEQLIGVKVPKFIVNNSYIPSNYRKLYQLLGKSASGLISRLESNLRKGEKAIIHTDGQKHQSQWGTRNLEAHIKRNFPDLKVLRIDRPSVKDKNHPAYQCIDHLNEILINYDVVICSPVIETGVSIDIQHFDGVYVISHGVQTVDSVVQTLQRVRSNIPRYLWCQGWSKTRIGNGSYEIKSLLSSTHKLASATISLLQKMGITEANELTFYEENEDLKGCSPSLTAWAKRGCVINYQNQNFAQSVFSKCEALGYEVIMTQENEEKAQSLAVKMKQIKEENYQKHCEERSTARLIEDEKEYEKLKEKQEKGETTEEEDLILEKYQISRLYLTEEVSPDLIKKHDQGWYPKIQLHYYLTVGNVYLPDKEKKAVQKLKEQGDGEVFKPDLNRNLLGMRIFSAQTFNLEQFLDPEAEFTEDSLQEWFKPLQTPTMKFQIKAIYNFGIGEQDSAIGVVQRFLAVFGLKLRYDRRQRINGKAVRVYKGAIVDPDGRSEIFSRWLERDSQAVQEAA